MYIGVQRSISERAAKATWGTWKGHGERKSMKRVCVLVSDVILYVEVKSSMFSFSRCTNRRMSKFSKGFDQYS